MSRFGSNLGVLASISQRGRRVGVAERTGGIVSDSPASIVAGQLRDLLGAAISATETAINVRRLDLREARAARERESGQARELAHARLGADVERFLADGSEPDLSRLDDHDREVYRARFDAQVGAAREQEATDERTRRVQRRRQFIEAGLPADFDYQGDLDQIREMRLAAAGQAETMVRRLDEQFLAQPKGPDGRPSRMPSEFLEEVLREAPVNDPVYAAELRRLVGSHVLDRDFTIQSALDREQQRRNHAAAVDSIEQTWQREVFAADFDALPPLRPAGEMLVDSLERSHAQLTELGLDPADVKLGLLAVLADRAMATGDRRYLEAVKDWRFLDRRWWEQASAAFEKARESVRAEQRRADKRFFDAAIDEGLGNVRGAMDWLDSYRGARGAAAARQAAAKLAQAVPHPPGLAGARLGNPVAAIALLSDPVRVAAVHEQRLTRAVDRALAQGVIDETDAARRRAEIAEAFTKVGRDHQVFTAALARFEGADAAAGISIDSSPEIDRALGALWDAEVGQVDPSRLPATYEALARRARAIPTSHAQRLSRLVESADPNEFRAGVEILDAVERIPGVRLNLSPDAQARAEALRALRSHVDLDDLVPRLLHVSAETNRRADATRTALLGEGETIDLVEGAAQALGVADAASIRFVDPSAARLLDAAYRLRFAELLAGEVALDERDAAGRALTFSAHETAGRLQTIRVPNFDMQPALFGLIRQGRGGPTQTYLLPSVQTSLDTGFSVRAFVQREEFRPIVEAHLAEHLGAEADLVDDLRFRFDHLDRATGRLPIEAKIGGAWMFLPEPLALPTNLVEMQAALESGPVQAWRRARAKLRGAAMPGAIR